MSPMFPLYALSLPTLLIASATVSLHQFKLCFVAFVKVANTSRGNAVWQTVQPVLRDVAFVMENTLGKASSFSPNLTHVLLTSLFDCYVHFPFLLLPSFYLITQTVGKGSSLRTAWARMRAEWRTAVAGSAVFWTPASFVSFGMVPQHSRVLVIAAFSFVHKTWLSWLSNRESVGAGAVAPSA